MVQFEKHIKKAENSNKKVVCKMSYKLILKKLNSNRVEYYLLPALILIGIVFFVPVYNSFRLSFYDVHTVAGVRGFVGTQNYKSLLTPELLATFWRTIVYVIGSIPPTVILSLLMAAILNQDVPGKKIFWILSFLPWTIPHSIAAILWRWFIHSEYGYLNHILVLVGILEKPKNFLSVDVAMGTCIILRMWKAIPFAILSFIVRLQAIPEELYEAAEVDGATWWNKLIYIILPSLRQIIISTSLLLGIWGFVTFDLIWVLTEGGPLNATETIPIAIYRLAFQQNKSGLASALGVVSLFILLAFCIVYFKIVSRGEEDN